MSPTHRTTPGTLLLPPEGLWRLLCLSCLSFLLPQHQGMTIATRSEVLSPVTVCGQGTCGKLGSHPFALVWALLHEMKQIFLHKASGCPRTLDLVCAVAPGLVAPHAAVCVQRCFVTTQNLSSLQENKIFQQE